MKIVGLIMAGGSGTRFWPLSRKKYPKQALKLTGDKEMINLTIDRCYPFISSDDMHIVTNCEQKQLLEKITGDRLIPDSIFAEPAARNTAPCILYSAIMLYKKYGDAIMCVFSADHSIKDESTFRDVLKTASDYAAQFDGIVTIGIVPTFPSIGYGYVNKGGRIEGANEIYRVMKFVEKPDLDTAAEYIRSGNYLWNSGMFVFRVATILDSFKRYLPEMYQAMEPLIGLPKDQEDEFINNIYPNLERISIDYGIMEKEANIAVIPGDFGWSDIGAWNTLSDILPADSDGNIVRGDYIGLDTKDCVVFSEGQTITTIGLSNVVIVSTKDSVLVCNMDSVQNIKLLTDELEKRNRQDLL